MVTAKNYTDTLLEDINGKFDYVVEAVGSINDQLKNIPKRDEFNELKDEVHITRLVVTDHSRQLSEHQRLLDEHERFIKAI